jgi:uncharacterized damage-inducible protein DinB
MRTAVKPDRGLGNGSGRQLEYRGKLPRYHNRTAELVHWLEATWEMVENNLKSWDVSDLARTYLHKWNGQVYTVSRQWTIWRVLSHDIHHGGELSLMLGLQDIQAFELSNLFGHIILPPLADQANPGGPQ